MKCHFVILVNMYHFDEASTLVGVSELRTQLDKILKLAKSSKVYLGKRQKPVAVLVPIEKYQEVEALLDRVEDAVLGYIAQARDQKTKLKDYVSLDAAEKKVGLKK